MKRLSRSTALKIAAVYNFLTGILGFFTSIPFLAQGAEALNRSGDTAPFSIFFVSLMLAPLQIMGAYGAWRNQRWGIVLLIVASVVDLFGAAPGLLVAPTAALRLLAASGILLDTLVIVLCLWRDRTPSAQT
ncbi:MAG: hypothetical protein U0175_31510 [Caldilineaceae bacterium]